MFYVYHDASKYDILFSFILFEVKHSAYILHPTLVLSCYIEEALTLSIEWNHIQLWLSFR